MVRRLAHRDLGGGGAYKQPSNTIDLHFTAVRFNPVQHFSPLLLHPLLPPLHSTPVPSNMTTTSSSPSHDIPFSPQWDDPLPHALSLTKHYLTSPRRGQTKAALILMHGRGSDAEDIASAFLPTLQIRFGGKKEGVVEEDEQQEGEVAVVAIEAKDGAWYPQSHNGTFDAEGECALPPLPRS